MQTSGVKQRHWRIFLLQEQTQLRATQNNALRSLPRQLAHDPAKFGLGFFAQKSLAQLVVNCLVNKSVVIEIRRLDLEPVFCLNW